LAAQELLWLVQEKLLTAQELLWLVQEKLLAAQEILWLVQEISLLAQEFFLFGVGRFFPLISGIFADFF
jgi:hypothetical protein